MVAAWFAASRFCLIAPWQSGRGATRCMSRPETAGIDAKATRMISGEIFIFRNRCAMPQECWGLLSSGYSSAISR
jgi:hypothetical protein